MNRDATLRSHYPRIIEHEGQRVICRGIDWRRANRWLFGAGSLFLVIGTMMWLTDSPQYLSLFAVALSLLVLGGLACLSAVTRYTLVLDRATGTYTLSGGWPRNRSARHGALSELAGLRLVKERRPRRSRAVLCTDGKWLLGPRCHRGWLVLYLDIPGNPRIACQLQSSALPPQQHPAAGESIAALRELLFELATMLRIPALNLAEAKHDNSTFV